MNFPWLYVLRWVIGGALVAHGLYRLYVLSASWQALTEQAIIFPYLSPYRYLPAALLKVATGVAMLFRSKLSILLVIGWVLAIVIFSLGIQTVMILPIQSLLGVLEPLTVLLFLCLILQRKLLR